MTKFSAVHPGGKRILLNVAGKDASKQFKQFHSPAVALNLLPKYYVGDVTSIVSDAVAKQPSTSGSAVKKNEWWTGDNEVFGDLAPFCEPAYCQDNYTPCELKLRLGFDTSGDETTSHISVSRFSADYKESHRVLRSFMRNWVAENILPFMEEWEEKAQKNTEYLPKSLHQAAGKAGIVRVLPGPISWGPKNKVATIPGVPALPAGIPEGSFDFFHESIVWDELANCGNYGILSGITIGAAFGLSALIKYGSEDMLRRVVPEVLRGDEQIALCITEPHAGSDVQGILTTAKLSDDGQSYSVNGEKKWITNGAYAKYFTSAVRTGGAGGAGISIMLLERGPGLTTRQVYTQTSPLAGTAYVMLEDHKVPATNLIGGLNQGFKALMLK